MNILQVKNLKVQFGAGPGTTKAVDDVSFDIRDKEVFGLVGESGSGKTMTALSILKLIPSQGAIAGGEIVFNGIDIFKAGEEDLRSIRGSRIAMIFQEPLSSFNPVFTIGEQMMEAVIAHRRQGGPAGAKGLCLEYLERVHIPEPSKIFHDYPHQLSGGTRQRVMIAMALVNSPELLILDEPTTALDVTVQAKILDLLEEIRSEGKVSMLFISHDLGIIARMCDRVAVMQRGRIVETGGTKELFYNPKDPYTIALLESVKALA
ncbi:MAG: ABC transporter ATP-binding protein [Candidatus Omnitrophota bacterium]